MGAWDQSEYARNVEPVQPPSTSSETIDIKALVSTLSQTIQKDLGTIVSQSIDGAIGKLEERLDRKMEKMEERLEKKIERMIEKGIRGALEEHHPRTFQPSA